MKITLKKLTKEEHNRLSRIVQETGNTSGFHYAYARLMFEKLRNIIEGNEFFVDSKHEYYNTEEIFTCTYPSDIKLIIENREKNNEARKENKREEDEEDNVYSCQYNYKGIFLLSLVWSNIFGKEDTQKVFLANTYSMINIDTPLENYYLNPNHKESIDLFTSIRKRISIIEDILLSLESA